MKVFNSQKFLTAYSGILTLILSVVVLTGFARHGHPKFDTITVQRINVVEPDGTLRMVLANNNRIPSIIMHGKEYPDFTARQESTAAGIYFYDAEGSESGGLTFGGRRAADGSIHRFGHLAFDGYEQDQLFAIDVVDDGTNHRSKISFFDTPDWSIVELLELQERIMHLPDHEKEAAIAEFYQAHPTDTAGVRTALINMKAPDAPSLSVNQLQFNDRASRNRLNAGLDDTDEPSVELFDESGDLTYRIPPN